MDELDVTMEQARVTRDPETALIITQNTEGEIVDAEIIHVLDAYYVLFHGPNAPGPEKKPHSGASWWAPSTKTEGGQSE